MIHIVAFGAAFVTCAWYAFTVGGKPERAAMFAQLVALILSMAVGFLTVSGNFVSLVAGWALVDGGLAIVLIMIALTSNRHWPIVLAGLQVAATFVHLAKLAYPELPATGYAIFTQMWAWPMLLVTAIGTRNHRLRRLRLGRYPDWKRTPAAPSPTATF